MYGGCTVTFLESTNPVTTVSGTSPIASTEGTIPVISIDDSTTDQKGAVQLEDSYTSTSVIKAATPKSVKDVYDYATILSGTLQDSIDSKSGTLLELSDTPSTYDVNKYLRSTNDGTEWHTVDSSSTFLDLTDTPTTYSGSVGKYLKVSSGELGLEYADIDGGTATTTVSGWDVYDATTYYADFEHNLNTNEISVFIIDVTTNKAVGVEDIEILNVNTIRIYVTDDTSLLKINVITGGFVDTDHNHDDRYYTESEVDTISGSLQTDINSKINNAAAIKWAIVFGGM